MTKFRSKGGPVRLASTSGAVAIVDKEWRELPEELHLQALGLGCESDGTSTASRGPDQEEQDQLIRLALTKMLERKEEGDFNADESPNARVVAKLTGLSVKKDDVMRVYDAMKAEAGGGTDGAED